MLVTRAHAKLNLALAVTSRREDGWHDIDSVLVPIDWHDLIGVQVLAAEKTSVSLRLTGPAANGVPSGEHNLAVRAASALADLAHRPLGIAVWLDKHVPYAAGLGGGSADAAATLQTGTAVLETLGIAIDASDLATAALTVGSDVPALLAGGAQHVQGRGDCVSALRAPAFNVVVVSTKPSSTAATYAALAHDDMNGHTRIQRLIDSLAAGQRPDDLLLGSALEPAAVRANPSLAAALQRARAVGTDHIWHLTGSGGALFTLVGTADAAHDLAQRMSNAGFNARACRTQPSAG
jgi:4-diphosphocytidyl-2-C-methyl-D-erythritol kinase